MVLVERGRRLMEENEELKLMTSIEVPLPNASAQIIDRDETDR